MVLQFLKLIEIHEVVFELFHYVQTAGLIKLNTRHAMKTYGEVVLHLCIILTFVLDDSK
jgi:hypothetical protein